MFRSKGKFLILAIVLIGAMFLCVADTQAGWWHAHHWGGYWGYPGYSYASWYVPSYGCCGYAYPYYRCGHRCGWRSCCSPCYYTSCCTSCCSEPCCSTVLSPAEPAADSDPTPTPAPPQQPDPTPPATDTFQPLDLDAGPQTKSAVPADAGLLTIRVPEGATVFINGYRTHSTGTERQYLSKGLKPGFSYKYEVRAEMVRDGRLVEDTQVAYLKAGNTQHVAVSFDAASAERLATAW